MRPRHSLALPAVVTLLLLQGCGTPPWVEARSTPTPVVTATPTAAATATPSPTGTPTRNDLAKGSLKRTLSAGGVKLTTTYYSTLDLRDWTPVATKPLTVSTVGAFADGSPQNIYLSKLTVTTDVSGPDGPLPAPGAMVDDASVAPGYLITAPTSYGKVFTLPALDPAATSVTFNLTYEVLAQVAPKSDRYAKQGASDTFVVALAG